MSLSMSMSYVHVHVHVHVHVRGRPRQVRDDDGNSSHQNSPNYTRAPKRCTSTHEPTLFTGGRPIHAGRRDGRVRTYVRNTPIWPAGAAQEADWPRLAGAWSSLAQPLALVKPARRPSSRTLVGRPCVRHRYALFNASAEGLCGGGMAARGDAPLGERFKPQVAEYLHRMTARPAWLRAQREQLVKDVGGEETREPCGEWQEAKMSAR
jgi:hypothetical protein